MTMKVRLECLHGRRGLVLVLWMPLIGFLLAVGLVAALGRDLDGRYAASPLKPWFDQLESGWGRCCSDADGRIVEDADWETKDGHYRVRVPSGPGSKDMLWVIVPDRSVVTEPNRTGRTMVWPVYVDGYQDDGFDNGVWIRCFMPGSMT